MRFFLFPPAFPGASNLKISSRRASAAGIPALASLLLAGCAALPTSGPTSTRIVKSVGSAENQIGYTLVDIAPESIPAAGDALSVDLQRFSMMGASAAVEPSDLIRRGDTLSVNIYEVGVALFGGGGANPILPENPAATNPVANAHRIVLTVDEEGLISLPYLGVFRAAGATPSTLAAAIQRQLRAYSQSPQATVAITDSVENVVYLVGAVERSGRYRLTVARERLLDVIALAGGVKVDPNDAVLRLVRGSNVATIPLAELQADTVANIMALPGDRLEIVKQRKTFTVFGASDQVAEIPFESRHLSLAEAIARAKGPSDSRADPAGVFLFRYAGTNPGEQEPVIYRLNLMKAESYFLAQKFEMRDKDVLFFANASANLPAKFINLLNQLFSPAVTARVLTQPQ